jgi:hypothetical protein
MIPPSGLAAAPQVQQMLKNSGPTSLSLINQHTDPRQTSPNTFAQALSQGQQVGINSRQKCVSTMQAPGSTRCSRKNFGLTRFLQDRTTVLPSICAHLRHLRIRFFGGLVASQSAQGRRPRTHPQMTQMDADNSHRDGIPAATGTRRLRRDNYF